MTIAAILRTKGAEIASVRPDERIDAVAGLLSGRRIGAVVVRGPGGELLGIVSERDIVHALARHGASTLDMAVDHLMTRAVQTATPHTTVEEAMAIMTTGRFRHLPVLEHDRLVGIVSIGDIVKARMDPADPGGRQPQGLRRGVIAESVECARAFHHAHAQTVFRNSASLATAVALSVWSSAPSSAARRSIAAS